MPDRLDVLKTYKLFIGGAFPRSESGRSTPVLGPNAAILAHISKASRKDLREAVEAARKAQHGWAGATAYNRGQVLYRLAEMLEGKRAELATAIDAVAPATPAKPKGKKPAKTPAPGGEREVRVAIDRVVHYAGWADKYAQVLGCNNPVSGNYYNFTITEPTGVVAVIAPNPHPLLGLVSLIAPALCSGNAVVALASEANPLPALILAEACATCDLPDGVLNILTGEREELLPQFASHRDIDAILAAGLSHDQATLLRAGAAENLKRVHLKDIQGDALDWYNTSACENPWWIEPLVESKTVWHPASV